MRSVALRAVPLPAPSYERLDVAPSGEMHSLLSLMGYLSPWNPDLAQDLIQRFSQKDDVVADLSCAAGGFLLQSALCSRFSAGAEACPLLSFITTARTKPADICQIALALQMLSLSRPLDVRLFREEFQPFYDLMTFREIHHLRSVVRGAAGYVESFLGLLALSLLHGPSSSYLSGYSSPYMSLGVDDQEKLNTKKGYYPSHRPLSPRLLKRAALVLRDGIPERLTHYNRPGDFASCYPWDVPHISTSELSLVVFCWDSLGRYCEQETLPEVIRAELRSSGSLRRQALLDRENQWLRSWFLGLDIEQHKIVKSYRELLSEVLLEAARVTKVQGRCVFECPSKGLRDCFVDIVQSELGRFWHVESFYEYRAESDAESKSWAAQNGELVVLRRLQ